MTDLRLIVRRHQEEAVLKKHLKEKYDSTTEEEKKNLLKLVESLIDTEVEDVLRNFLHNATSKPKGQKFKDLLNAIIHLALTTGIAYCVNIEQWVVTTILGAILVLSQTYNVFK